jgi:ABC-type transport system involved in multi-copper enzyme maturation permease subunit
MIASVLWKEYREQRPVWLAVAAIAAFLISIGFLFLVPAGSAPFGTEKATVLVGIAVALTVAYAVVAGAMLFAGERENGTLDLLDTLPVRRADIWLGKFAAGSAAVLAFAFVAAVAMCLLHVQPATPVGRSSDPRWLWFKFLPPLAFYAFAFSLLGSALARSVLRAAALGTALGLLTLAIAAIAGMILTTAVETAERAIGNLIVFFSAAGGIIALYGSRRAFIRLDRIRRQETTAVTSPRHEHVFTGFVPTMWLVWQQGRALALGLIIAAIALCVPLALGVALLLDTPTKALLFSLMSWPVFTLLISVLCGLMTFAGEQAWQSQRFLGDRRLPLGRIWLWKTGVWLALAAAITFIVSVCSSAPFLGRTWAVQWPWWLNQSRWALWLMCLSYGFALGQLCGLLFSRPAVGGLIALLLSPVIVLWLPSLTMGGQHFWILLLPAALLLASAWLAVRPWTAGTLWLGRRCLTWVSVAALAPVAIALGIWYRAIEIPAVPAPFDVESYRKTLTTPMGTESGVLLHDALHDLEQRLAHAKLLFHSTSLSERDFAALRELEAAMALSGIASQQAAVSLSPAAAVLQLRIEPFATWNPENRDSLNRSPLDRLHFYASLDWIDLEMARLLDYLHTGRWVQALRKLPDLPPGTLVDPCTKTPFTKYYVNVLQDAFLILDMHAQLLEERGDPAAALEDYASALALAMSVKNQADTFYDIIADRRLSLLLNHLDRWLRRTGRDPILVKRAQALLQRTEQMLPSWTENLKENYVELQNATESDATPLPGSSDATLGGALVFESAPWERERQTRLLNAVFAGFFAGQAMPWSDWVKRYADAAPLLRAGWIQPTSGPAAKLSHDQLAAWLEPTWWSIYVVPQTSRRPSYTRTLCRLRGNQLKLALTRYEVEHGKSAPHLAALVPDYIADIPIDPYDGKPFRYRISPGERIPYKQYLETTWIEVRPGQGIIWSVGPDAIDDGGKIQAAQVLPGKLGNFDVVFLVPRLQELAASGR